MADLMSGSPSYESLAKKYKDFMVPAFKIKVRGTDVASSLGLAIEDLSVSLSLDAANTCGFSIVNAYDRQSSAFIGKIKSELKLGTVLTVEIGYGSSLTMVFKGYVSELAYNFQDYPTLSVTCMDVRHLMMEGEARMLIHSVQSYSAAFSEVMKRYQKICTNLVIDQTDSKLPNVTQSSSDYKFVTEDLCMKADREFFVLADKAYFRVPQKVEDPLTTLDWGKGLISFSRNSTYLDSIIRVIGFDERNKEKLVGEAVSKSDDDQTSVIAEPQPTIITQPDAKDAAQVKDRAEREAIKKKQKSQSGKGACIGLPEVVPGRYIAIGKVDPALEKKYYIKSVNHSLGSDGFSTSFTIGGWK